MASQGLLTRLDSLRADLDVFNGGRVSGDVEGTIACLKAVVDKIRQIA